MSDWADELRKVRQKSADGLLPLVQLDDGEWATPGEDTSGLRQRLGWVDRVLPAERGEADVVV